MIRYKTFDNLMAAVESDLKTYADDGYIDRQNFIKEARRVNSDLGLRIYKDREAMVNVKDYKADLPYDFLFLQLAMACDVSYVSVPRFSNIKTEDSVEFEKVISEQSGDVCSFGGPQGRLIITQNTGVKNYKFEDVRRLSLTKGSSAFCSDNCLNHFFRSPDQIDIIDDSEARFSFREGKVYINYLADLLDEDGNLLILDHPLVNDYYEYAIKKKFFENMKLNKEGDFLQDYQLTKAELREARTRAILFVNTQEYGELLSVYKENRKNFYNKYLSYFNDINQGIYNI